MLQSIDPDLIQSGYHILEGYSLGYPTVKAPQHQCPFLYFGKDLLKEEIKEIVSTIKSPAQLRAEAYSLKMFNDSKSKAGIKLKESHK
jgi:hypothetical protein